jgi:beta-N-acetylhexosaminidase
MTVSGPRLAIAAVALAAATAAATHPASARPAAASARESVGCVDVARWATARLAASTVVVPASESDVSTVGTEVSHGAGGVILFGSTAPADLGTQLAALRRLVPGHRGLLVMTDEEGGGVQRMANLVGSLPWARYMGRHWTRAEIRARVAAVAGRMARVGVNTDLAPVVDVDGRNVPPGPADADGWRSFSGRTSVVAGDGVAYMRGLRDGGVLAMLKHFPGLGGASRNTDDGTAYTLPWPTLRTVGLPPFAAGIRAGAPAIMVSNAIVPGLTRLPASLSPAAIQGELVRRLQFSGLILTDSLTSGAIVQAGFHVPRAAVSAVGAGADMVMYNAATPAATNRIFDATVAAEVAAVASGKLPRSRLVAAARATLTARDVDVCP